MKKTEHIVLNEEEVNSLLGRVLNCNLKDSDKKIITGIIQIYQVLQWSLQEAKISVQRLRSLFGFKQTEKRCHLDPCEKSSKETKMRTEENLQDNTGDSLGGILSHALESLKKVKNAFEKENMGMRLIPVRKDSRILGYETVSYEHDRLYGYVPERRSMLGVP